MHYNKKNFVHNMMPAKLPAFFVEQKQISFIIKQYFLMEEVKMRTITTIILALMLLIFVGCGNEDKSPQQ